MATTTTALSFRMPDIIKKKRDGHALSAEEISWMIERVVGKDDEHSDESQLGM